jgi:hypothetical protein
MNKSRFFFSLLFSLVIVANTTFAQHQPKTTPAIHENGRGLNKEDSAYIRDNYIKTEKLIPMRDGVKLFTSVYIPKDTSYKYPFILCRTPYSVSPYGASDV